MEYQLTKKRYRGRGNGDKYYIDCSKYNSDSITAESLIQNKKSIDQEVTILQAVATNNAVRQHHRHIVVKIGRNTENTKHSETDKEDMAHKEFRVGKSLDKFNGFLKYICLFSCFDDSIDKFSKNDTNRRPFTGKICNADEKINENLKYVLVMPFIREGSLANHNWTTENIVILKNLIIHTILSISTAFYHIGFIHGDLHLDNVLLKKTKITNYDYFFTPEVTINEVTRGYKPVIMDFEKAQTGSHDLYSFWDDLFQFTKNIDGITNHANQRVFWKEESQILTFIIESKKKQAPVRNILTLLDLIKESTLTLKNKPTSVSYNPDVF
jgi:hypothetical protein